MAGKTLSMIQTSLSYPNKLTVTEIHSELAKIMAYHTSRGSHDKAHTVQCALTQTAQCRFMSEETQLRLFSALLFSIQNNPELGKNQSEAA
jgi:hypothetical protein